MKRTLWIWAASINVALAGTTTYEWDPVQSYVDGSPIVGPVTYNLYENHVKVLGEIPTNSVERLNTNAMSYVVYVTAATSNGRESEPSNAITNNYNLVPNRPDFIRILSFSP